MATSKESSSVPVPTMASSILDSNGTPSDTADTKINPLTDPLIQHCIEWQGSKGNVYSRKIVSHEDFGINPSESESQGNKTAFQIVSVYKTHSEEKTQDFSAPSSNGSNIQATECSPHTSYLRIYSTAIKYALRSVVKYYPGQDLSGSFIDINWPYPILVHHYDELLQFQLSVAKEDPDEKCARTKDLDKHLSLLLKFLDKEIMEDVKAEIERNEGGFCTFDFMWVVLRPGKFTYYSVVEKDTTRTGVIYKLQGGTFTTPRQEWEVVTWSLDFDGTYLGRRQASVVQRKFDGETKLDWRCCDENKFEEFMQQDDVYQLVRQGRIYWDLNDAQFKYHEGITLGDLEDETHGMVMVDIKRITLQKRAEEEYPLRLMDTSDHRDFFSDCLCSGCKSGKRSLPRDRLLFEDYDLINKKDNPDLTEKQCFLCPRIIQVYFFKTRTWGTYKFQTPGLKIMLKIKAEKVHVANLSPPRFNRSMIKNLVMNEQKLQIITSLTGSFARLNQHDQAISMNPWTADYIDGKGNGLIFLLHGGPGVGKTFTAECIANFLERPLMILTTTDIGTNPTTVEHNLARNFKTAKAWNAVLLIDEADIFVANRTVDDLERSSLVASFLRALEFYDGILFLTTNRVGTFDDAILSRVHIQLHYPELNSEQRFKLWDNLIEKLERERPSLQVKYSVREYLESVEVSNYKMNGREIRNAFQNAVGIAEYYAQTGEAGKIVLSEKHLKEVIEPGQNFKKYFEQLRGSVAERAFGRGDRLE